MAWKDALNGDSVAWLMESSSPDVRYTALRDLSDAPPDAAMLSSARAEAHRRGPIAGILDAMDPEGYWTQPGPGYGPKYHSTVWALILLGQLGASAAEDERIARACRYYLDHALHAHGEISTGQGPGGTIDCLQGNLCAALLDMGCEDPRLDLAFDWMARTVTGDGLAPNSERKAEMRYYAYKCGPDFACGANYTLPCGWGAAKVMLVFAKLPAERRTPRIEAAIARGVDFLLGIDPVTADYPMPEGMKPNRAWWQFGFPVFYIGDILQIAEALARLGYGNDPRLASTLALVKKKQDAAGRWAQEYNYGSKTWGDFGRKGLPSPWVTLRALRTLKAAA
ncbi:MAG: nitrogen fixation protein NifH [Anaerolineae bacterium]